MQQLLQDPLLEEAIRAGDCLAMLVEHFFDRGQMHDAHNYLKEMEDRKIALHPYVDADVLEAVYKAVGRGGLNFDFTAGSTDRLSVDGDEEVEEEDVDEVRIYHAGILAIVSYIFLCSRRSMKMMAMKCRNKPFAVNQKENSAMTVKFHLL